MKMNFCTLFNSAYLSRGLVMYESLKKHSPGCHLYVYAFDEDCYNFLKKASLPGITVVSLKEFEDPDLLRVKPSRSAGEYCWTCTASTILFSIEKFSLDNCTYVDADMKFYDDPSLIWSESENASVIITEHNYSPEYDQALEAGRFCVQFVGFRNDEKGMSVLRQWRNQCIDWCYARVEGEKFGDQKYLNEWPDIGSFVHVVKNPGGGIAPWNLQQFTFFRENDKITGIEKSSGKKFPVVFFHFHGLKFFSGNIVSLTGPLYELHKNAVRVFYAPYLKDLISAGDSVRSQGALFDPHGSGPAAIVGQWNFSLLFRYYLYDLKRSVKNIGGRTLRDRKNHHHFYRVSTLIGMND